MFKVLISKRNEEKKDEVFSEIENLKERIIYMNHGKYRIGETTKTFVFFFCDGEKILFTHNDEKYFIANKIIKTHHNVSIFHGNHEERLQVIIIYRWDLFL